MAKWNLWQNHVVVCIEKILEYQPKVCLNIALACL